MRDKFLTEKMGLCWHDTHTKTAASGYDIVRVACSKCELTQWNIDFSTWQGFGMLLPHFMKSGDIQYITIHHHALLIVFKRSTLTITINNLDEVPSAVADALYEYLKSKETNHAG